MYMKKDHDLSTRCVHAGEVRDAQGSPHTPIYNTTTFGFRSTADLLDVVEGRREGNLYTRYGMNPTIKSVEASSQAWKTRNRPWCSPRAWRRKRRSFSPTAGRVSSAWVTPTAAPSHCS
ncbi:MAG: cystathionine gamma-synthase, partial [Actinobacteria bacterium]|nr:cystathionine gamma-synthase [Actinomycetota bacterium]